MPAPTVADALCAALCSEGVALVFGHPGGAILPFYDALFRHGAPRHVLMRHEQAAAHAADGYARATGRVGVCVATSGPGATNLVTGLATAMMDGVPLVAITGQVPTTVRGQDAFQESDIIGITMPVTKHGFLLEDPATLHDVVHEAFALARAGRPGPVLIDVPKDVQNARCATAVRGGPRPAASPLPVPVLLDAAAERLVTAVRPVVMAGRGVVLSGMSAALRTLAERADLPVVTTLLGLDGFPLTHPLALGMPGMHGSERANRALQDADLILGLGVRFDDRVIGAPTRFAPRAFIVHADIAPGAFGRTVRADLPLVGDLRATLPGLLDRVGPQRHAAWWSRLRTWARAAAPPEPWSAAGPLSGRQVCQALAAQVAAHGAAVATDVGQHQMWLAQELLDAAPGTHLTSGGLGTMGYALPAAIGAALGCPDRATWAVAGDGGFQMTAQELATVAELGLPIRIAVVNNGCLGMVRQWQDLYYARRHSASCLPGPDFVTLAAAYGIPARAVASGDALADGLAWAAGARGPVLLDLRVPADEHVYPMVPAGAALDELVLAPAAAPAP